MYRKQNDSFATNLRTFELQPKTLSPSLTLPLCPPKQTNSIPINLYLIYKYITDYLIAFLCIKTK